MFGIDAVKLLDNSNILTEVYPELSDIVAKVKQGVARDSKWCAKCARRKHSGRILVALSRIKYDGRDLKKLESFIPCEGIEFLKSL